MKRFINILLLALTTLSAYAVIPESVFVCEEANGTVMTITFIPEEGDNGLVEIRKSDTDEIFYGFVCDSWNKFYITMSEPDLSIYFPKGERHDCGWCKVIGSVGMLIIDDGWLYYDGGCARSKNPKYRLKVREMK